MAIKRYTLTHDFVRDVVIEIDDSICTDALLHEINNFWSNAKFRLDEAAGNITLAVLKMLAERCWMLSTHYFVDSYLTKEHNEEGWPILDGRHGIKLISVDDFTIDSDDIRLESSEVVSA